MRQRVDKFRITKDDRSKVVAVSSMSKSFHEEAKESGPFNPSRVSMFLSSVCNDPNAAMFVGISEDGQPVGFLVCQFGHNYLTGQAIAEETAVYVVPSERGGKLASALLDRFEGWAKEKGAARIRVTAQSSLHVETVCRWYRRRGYAESERSLTKEVLT